jgi:hypothetical protein
MQKKIIAFFAAGAILATGRFAAGGSKTVTGKIGPACADDWQYKCPQSTTVSSTLTTHADAALYTVTQKCDPHKARVESATVTMAEDPVTVGIGQGAGDPQVCTQGHTYVSCENSPDCDADDTYSLTFTCPGTRLPNVVLHYGRNCP